jgi:hypothetical protein
MLCALAARQKWSREEHETNPQTLEKIVSVNSTEPRFRSPDQRWEED